TSGGQHGDTARCRELGISAYLIKPVRQLDLLDSIRSVLGARRNAPKPQRLATGESVSKGRLRVLLAEDNRANQKLAIRMIEKWGHSVDAVENGRAAVDAVRNKKFDVVLMDVQMPEMGGFEAA